MKGGHQGAKNSANQPPNQAFRLFKDAYQPIEGGQPDWRGANNGHEVAARTALPRFFSSLLGSWSVGT
jgi:hypothetical protein